MFSELTPDEAGRLDGALFGALEDIGNAQPDREMWDQTACETWDEIADVLTNNLRAEHSQVTPSMLGFRLDQNGAAQ